MKNIKTIHNADPAMIKKTGDLGYLWSYAYFEDFKYNDIRWQAEDMFSKTGDIKAVDDFLNGKINATKAEKYKTQANLSKRFQKRTFETFKVEDEIQKTAYNKAVEYAKNIEKNIETGTNILFVGKGHVGTGKTHLACAIANDVLSRGIPVKVINIVALVDELKEFKSAQKRELKTVKVLLIDDLGKENSTTWLCSEIYGIINARYESELPTIITTEGSLKDLEDNYKIDVDGKIVNKGLSMVSRLTESCFLAVMDGEDYRRKAGAKCN